MKASEDSPPGRTSFERSGVDIRAALMSARSFAPSPDVAAVAVAPPGPAALPPRSFKSRVKRVLRRLAGVGFRAGQPFMRPVLFRLRAYLIAPLMAEMQRQGHHVVHLDLDGQVEQRLANFSLHQVQELQYTRDVLRREIRSLSSELTALRSADTRAGGTITTADAGPGLVDASRALLAAYPDIALIVPVDAVLLGRAAGGGDDDLQAYRDLGLELGMMDPRSGAIVPWQPVDFASSQSLQFVVARPGSPVWNRNRTGA